MFCRIEARIANPGDILFSVRAPVGRMNITLEKIVIGRGLAALRSRENHQAFLFYALKEHFIREDMIGAGAIYAAVTKSDMHRVELLAPRSQLVDDFEEWVAPIDRQIEILHRSLNQLLQARDLLLPRLFDGRLSV
jgi:type I restriction enzyme S subunit